jgi:hypothetical protein
MSSNAYSFPVLPGPVAAAVKWAAIAIGVVILVLALVIATRRVPAPTPADTEPSRSLPLTLTGGDGRLTLGWDRESPAIRAGQCGVLMVSDGSIHRRVLLDLSQLRSGKLFYWPVNKDVRFEMQMSGGETGCVNESMPWQKSADSPHRPKRRTERHRSHAVEPEDVSVSVNYPQNETSKPSAFAIQGESQLAEAVPVRAEKEIHSTAIRPVSQVAPEPHSSVTVEPVAVPESRLSRIAGKIPVLRRLHRTPEFLPPRPVRETTPSVPVLLRRTLKSEVPLDVHAYIDESGKVTYAEVQSNIPETNRALASIAVFDARRWEFTPAQLGGHAVRGEVILHYRFGNTLLAVSSDHP